MQRFSSSSRSLLNSLFFVVVFLVSLCSSSESYECKDDGDDKSQPTCRSSGEAKGGPCRTGEMLKSQLQEANQQLLETGQIDPTLDESLRGVVDLLAGDTADINMDWLLNGLPTMQEFTTYSSGDYGAYNAPQAYAGLGLKELNRYWKDSDKNYQQYVELRHAITRQAELALNLCTNTLAIHFTHLAQKTTGGQHRPHADNCYHTFVPPAASSAANNKKKTASSEVVVVPKCDEQEHPYSNRIAASILYLNSPTEYEGGQFYWSNRTSAKAQPETLVEPKVGRLTVFTAGPENLHGALPVQEIQSTKENTAQQQPTAARRITLAMWYVLKADGQAESDSGGAGEEDEDDDEYDRTILTTVPVVSVKIKSLKLALSLYLMGQQNKPTWTLITDGDSIDEKKGGDDTTTTEKLHMLFQDKTVMVSIRIKPNVIELIRVSVPGTKPGLMYQLKESMLLEGILEEIQSYATKPDLVEEKRLLVVESPNVFETAFASLPARRAKK